MGSRSALVLLLCAAALVVAALVWRDGEPAGPTSGSRAEEPVAEPVGARVAGSSAEPGAALERATVAPDDDPVGVETIRVTVVDDASGAPVASAEVVGFFDPPRPPVEKEYEEGRDGLSWNARARAAGRLQVTGADGTVLVPLPAERTAWAGARLQAHADGRYGQVAMPWSQVEAQREGGLTIRIHATHELVVEVVDGEARPAPGVTVVWLNKTAAPDREPERRSSAAIVARTDADGRARVPHFETFLDGPWLRGAHVVESAVTARVSGVDVPPVALPVDEVPAEPVRITLPPTGALRFVLPAGAMNFDARLSVEPAISAPDDSGRMWQLHVEIAGPTDAVREPNADVVTFPYVGLGARFHAQLREFNNVPRIDAVVDGPTRPGETVTVRLEESAPVLCGRLVDTAGQPISARCDVVGDVDGETDIRSASDGRFRHVIDARHVGQDGGAWELLLNGTAERPPLSGGFEWIRPLTPGDLEVGDVVLAPLPVLVEGRCVDDTGAAIPRPSVAALPIGSEPAEERVPWVVRQRTSQAVGRDDGTFVVYGTFAGTELALVASSRDVLASERTVVAVGSRNVTLVLPRAADAVATAVGLTEAHDVLAHLVAPDGTEVAATWYEFDDGIMTWQWSRIRPGTYRFVLRFGPTGAVLHRVDGVDVRPGETAGDPRLQGMRIDGVDTFRLRMRGADGGPLPEIPDVWGEHSAAHVFFAVGDTWLGRPVVGEHETLVNAPPPPARLLVVARGHRPAFVTWTGGDLEVRMTRAPQVVVRVPEGAQIETVALRGGPDLRLHTYGEYGFGDLDRWPGMTPRPPHDDEALFEVPEPGRYAIELTGPDADALQPISVDVGAGPRTEVALSRTR